MLRKGQFLPLVIVSFAVLLNVSCAVILKMLADQSSVSYLLLVFGITLVALLNLFRFLVWGYVHSRYPLSMSYPLSSIFFPLMLCVAYAYGDAISSNQLIGTILITSGVLWITFRIEP